jgi:hypothetical protein
MLHKGKQMTNYFYIGNCTNDEIIEELFGNVTNFAYAVENNGDDFVMGNLIVKYDTDKDIHNFYFI